MILNQHPELYEMLKDDITLGQASSSFGRQDIPTVEQIMRAAIYKEMKSLRSSRQGCESGRVKVPAPSIACSDG